MKSRTALINNVVDYIVNRNLELNDKLIHSEIFLDTEYAMSLTPYIDLDERCWKDPESVAYLVADNLYYSDILCDAITLVKECYEQHYS